MYMPPETTSYDTKSSFSFSRFKVSCNKVDVSYNKVSRDARPRSGLGPRTRCTRREPEWMDACFNHSFIQSGFPERWHHLVNSVCIHPHGLFDLSELNSAAGRLLRPPRPSLAPLLGSPGATATAWRPNLSALLCTGCALGLRDRSASLRPPAPPPRRCSAG